MLFVGGVDIIATLYLFFGARYEVAHEDRTTCLLCISLEYFTHIEVWTSALVVELTPTGFNDDGGYVVPSKEGKTWCCDDEFGVAEVFKLFVCLCCLLLGLRGAKSDHTVLDTGLKTLFCLFNERRGGNDE